MRLSSGIVLTSERRAELEWLLHSTGRLVTADAAAQLGVSIDTVRRDLERLEERGVLRRVRGGALPPAPRVPAAFSERLVRRTSEKAAIGARAARRIAGDDIVLLGGGPTVVELARQWPVGGPSTVVTTSLDVALELAGRDGVVVVLAGGRLLADEHTVVGAETVAALGDVRADTCVLGAGSLDAEAGQTFLHREEAQVGRAMVAAARRTLVLADAEKLGTVGPYAVAAAERIATLITDAAAPVEVTAALDERGVEIDTP